MAKSAFFDHAMSIRGLHQSRDAVCFVALCRTGALLVAVVDQMIPFQLVWIAKYICIHLYSDKDV